ncbi:MAG: ABC transporter permease [bacterium]
MHYEVKMISKENMQYSLKNLWIRKSRSFLTILSIFLGIATIFIFVSFGLGLYSYVEEIAEGGYADKFIVEGRGMGAPGTSEVVLDESDLDTVEGTLGVFEASGSYFSAAKIQQDKTIKYVYAVGYNPKTDLMMESFNIGIEKGRKLDRDDNNKVVLGYNYMFDNKIFPGKLDLNENIEIDGEKFRIIGFMESIGNPSDDANIYMTEDTFKKTFPDVDSYAMIVGRADIDEMDQTINRVEKTLRKDRGEEEGKETFTVASFSEQIEAIQSVLNIIVGFIILIALISVVVSAVNTANTMVTSVLERIREIGIIKSIGAKNIEIFNIFLFESSFLGLVAGIIGVILGWIVSSILGIVLDNLGWGFLSPQFSIELFVGCVLFATIVGAISGVAHAYNAAKRKPVDALRDE